MKKRAMWFYLTKINGWIELCQTDQPIYLYIYLHILLNSFKNRWKLLFNYAHTLAWTEHYNLSKINKRIFAKTMTVRMLETLCHRYMLSQQEGGKKKLGRGCEMRGMWKARDVWKAKNSTYHLLVVNGGKQSIYPLISAASLPRRVNTHFTHIYPIFYHLLVLRVYAYLYCWFLWCGIWNAAVFI